MNLFIKSSAVLHPENSMELLAWSKKWHITTNELGRAIVETGSINIRELHRYIRKTKLQQGQDRNINPGISDLAISK